MKIDTNILNPNPKSNQENGMKENFNSSNQQETFTG
jgi:hypothetical protein